eukprot:GHVO01017066.1.p1 GENE.GHVO01017066.1~~GHVO01017066.1.p1  ORF type:complete len:838 (+),score=153.61 GHVO01017066.1:27-2516(+)
MPKAPKEECSFRATVGGGFISSVPPVYFHPYVICASSAYVIIKESNGGKTKGRISKHNNDIIRIGIIHDRNGYYYTLDKGGGLIIWDFDERAGVPKCIHESQIDLKNGHLLTFSFLSGINRAHGVIVHDGKTCLYTWDLLDRVIIAGDGNLKWSIDEIGRDACISGSGDYTAIVINTNVYLIDIVNDMINTYPSENELVAVAVNEEKGVVATGDISGKTHIWHIIRNDTNTNHMKRDGETSIKGRVKSIEGGKSSTVYAVRGYDHWHAHPVSSLIFSSDGLSLISGGEEGVLVSYNLDIHTRQYLPRLGSPILNISVYNTKYPNRYEYIILGMANNSFILIDTNTNTIHGIIRGIDTGAVLGRYMSRDAAPPLSSDLYMINEYPYISYDDYKGIVLLPYRRRIQLLEEGYICPSIPFGLTGISQRLPIMDVNNDTVLGHVNVQQRDYVPRTTEALGHQWIVQTCSVNSHSIMTCEMQDGKYKNLLYDTAKNDIDTSPKSPSATGGRSYTLKFWKRAPSASLEWELESQIDTPHVNDITSGQPLGADDGFVTFSLDGHFKVWDTSDDDEYTLKYTSTYNDLPILTGCVYDNYIIASHGRCITVWKTYKSSEPLYAMPFPNQYEDGQYCISMCVMKINDIVYLVGASEKLLAVWKIQQNDAEVVWIWTPDNKDTNLLRVSQYNKDTFYSLEENCNKHVVRFFRHNEKGEFDVISTITLPELIIGTCMVNRKLMGITRDEVMMVVIDPSEKEIHTPKERVTNTHVEDHVPPPPSLEKAPHKIHPSTRTASLAYCRSSHRIKYKRSDIEMGRAIHLGPPCSLLLRAVIDERCG